MCLASATLTGSLPIYFRKHLGFDSVTATELNNALQALFNLTPIIGAYLADKYIGRFNTYALSTCTGRVKTETMELTCIMAVVLALRCRVSCTW